MLQSPYPVQRNTLDADRFRRWTLAVSTAATLFPLELLLAAGAAGLVVLSLRERAIDLVAAAAAPVGGGGGSTPKPAEDVDAIGSRGCSIA